MKDPYSPIPGGTKGVVEYISKDPFDEGEEIITQAGEYHSHNTHRLDEDELTNLLLGLREIQDDL